eukprot:5202716-Prymnesium_polylepis.2
MVDFVLVSVDAQLVCDLKDWCTATITHITLRDTQRRLARLHLQLVLREVNEPLLDTHDATSFECVVHRLVHNLVYAPPLLDRLGRWSDDERARGCVAQLRVLVGFCHIDAARTVAVCGDGSPHARHRCHDGGSG